MVAYCVTNPGSCCGQPEYCDVCPIWGKTGTTGYQIGGDHYKNNAIQPIDYIMGNGLDFCEGNVIKYVTRWKDKGGIEDLKKARQYIDFLIDKENNNAT